MLIFFRQKPNSNEFSSRNYDIAGSGFAPLSLAKKSDENQNFVWSLKLIKDLLAIYLAIFLSALGYGILMVLIAFRLEANVKNEILMSFCIATQIGAGVIFSRFLPIFGDKFGMIKSIYIGSILSAICAILLYKYINYPILLLVIFFLGTSFFICGVTRNTIMINLAPNHIRSIIISIGNMLVAIGNSLGPIFLSIVKTDERFLSFLFAAIFFLLSALPLRRLVNIDSNISEDKKLSIWRYIFNTPKIMFAGFSCSYAMSSSSAFAIIYGLKIGMPHQEASLLLSVLLFGTILYLPIGYLCDILNKRFLMIFCGILALICAYILYGNSNFDKIYLLLFLMFGLLAGVKLPAIVLINEKYKPSQRLAVNSAFARVSLIGNVCGLLTTGVMMKTLGAQGLWFSIILILSLFLLFCLINYSKKMANKELKFVNFSIFNKKTNEEIN